MFSKCSVLLSVYVAVFTTHLVQNPSFLLPSKAGNAARLPAPSSFGCQVSSFPELSSTLSFLSQLTLRYKAYLGMGIFLFKYTSYVVLCPVSVLIFIALLLGYVG